MINNLMALPPALLLLELRYLFLLYISVTEISILLIPIFSFFAISQLPEGSLYSVSFLHYELELLELIKSVEFLDLYLLYVRHFH